MTQKDTLDFYGEPATGYLVLTDGRRRQIVARVGEDGVYLWWRRGDGREHPVAWTDIFRAVAEAMSQ